MTATDERLLCEATIVVTIDGDDPATHTADATTTGDPNVVAQHLISGLARTIARRLEHRADEDPPAPTVDRRHASVTGRLTIDGEDRTVALDTTTNSDVYVAAISLVDSVREELWDWAYDRQHAKTEEEVQS